MAKLLRPTIIVLLLLSIGALVLGIFLFMNREQLKGRADKHADAVMALSEKLTAPRDPFIKKIKDQELVLTRTNLLDYVRMDNELSNLSKTATIRLNELFDTAQDLKNTGDELAATLDELARTKQELQAARDEIARLEGVVAEKERELAIANERIDSLESEKATLEEEIAGLNDNIKTLEISKEDLEAENKSLELQLRKLLPQTGSEVTDTPEGLSGEVVLVNSDWNFVVVDIGAEDRLAPLTQMLVHRGEHLVGKVRSTQVENQIAVCEIDRGFEQIPIQAGDKVFYPGVN
jgi:chromosome segregation ATPase